MIENQEDGTEIICRKYSLAILRALGLSKSIRFKGLLQAVPGITPRTLSLRLKEMIGAGMIERRRYKEIPPRVEYSLTEASLDLIECLKVFEAWATKWNIRIKRPPATAEGAVKAETDNKGLTGV